MRIDTSAWKWFPIGGPDGIFKIESCKCSNASELADGDDIAYIGAKKSNNGVMKRVMHDERLVTKGNCIVFICDGQGSVGYANYMEEDFIGSTTLSVGYNEHLNRMTGLYLVTILDRERPKYSFGRKYRKNLSKTRIKLPADRDGRPDWAFMERFMRSLKYKPIKTRLIPSNETIDFGVWKEYKFEDIFLISKGKRLTKADMVQGTVNFLGAISENNGVREKIETESFWRPNCITVNYNGSVGEAFYQAEPFWASDDVNVLYAKNFWEMNPYNALFLITVIKANQYRFGYGRKWTLDKMKETTIKLPGRADGNPDFAYMERYIKSLPYSDRIII